MAFLRKVFGGGKKEEEAAPPEPTGPVVSANRYWRCPDCGGVQGKPELDQAFLPGQPLSATGTVTCRKCEREQPAAAVYGGDLDFTGEAEVLSRKGLAQKYIDAQIAGDADALESLLAPDAVSSTMRGEVVGAKAIADRLRNPQGPGAGFMGRIQWEAPVEDGDQVRIAGKPPAGGPGGGPPGGGMFTGMTMVLTFNEANKISRIEMKRNE
jgi:hypothetical protein